MWLAIERWYPLALGIIAAILYRFTPASEYQPPETLSALMAAVVSVGGIFVGFLATAKSILVSIDDKEIVKKLKKARYYRAVIAYIRLAILWSFALTIYSAAALLVDFKGTQATPFQWQPWHATLFSVWIFLLVGSIASYYRVAQIFYGVLDGLGDE